MPNMYKKGSMPINVHPSQIETAKARGWTLDQPSEKTVKSKGVEENGNI